MILTISVPMVCHEARQHQFTTSFPTTTITHILRARSLQVHRALKQPLEHGEHTLPLETPLQARQQLQIKLHIPPLPLPNLPLDQPRQLHQQHIHDLWPRRVGEQHDSRNKRRLEGLLDGQLQDQVDKVAPQQLVVPVVGEQRRDRLDLLVPGAHRVLGDGDELLAHAHVGRRIVAAAGRAAAVKVVVVC